MFDVSINIFLVCVLVFSLVAALIFIFFQKRKKFSPEDDLGVSEYFSQFGEKAVMKGNEVSVVAEASHILVCSGDHWLGEPVAFRGGNYKVVSIRNSEQHANFPSVVRLYLEPDSSKDSFGRTIT